MVTVGTQRAPAKDKPSTGDSQQPAPDVRRSASPSPFLGKSFVLLGREMYNRGHRRAASIERTDSDSARDVSPVVIEATEGEVEPPAPAAANSATDRKIRNLQILLATAAITAVVASACAIHFQRQSATYQSLYSATLSELASFREQVSWTQSLASVKGIALGS